MYGGNKSLIGPAILMGMIRFSLLHSIPKSGGRLALLIRVVEDPRTLDLEQVEVGQG